MTKPEVIIYTAPSCPFCARAKQLLEKKGLSYKEIRIEADTALREEMVAKSGRQSVPQIFINGQHIGGYDDLATLNSQNGLDKFLKQ